MRFRLKRGRFKVAETIEPAYFAADVWARETTMSSVAAVTASRIGRTSIFLRQTHRDRQTRNLVL